MTSLASFSSPGTALASVSALNIFKVASCTSILFLLYSFFYYTFKKLKALNDSIPRMCQVILGQLITPIFQALSFCTLLSTALRLLAGLQRLGSEKQNLTFVDQDII